MMENKESQNINSAGAAEAAVQTGAGIDTSRIDAVFFDLDGTLLKMDMDLFTREYCRSLAKFTCTFGIDPEAFVSALWKGTGAIARNDGRMSNEALFIQTVKDACGFDINEHQEDFNVFYERWFPELQYTSPQMPGAAGLIRDLKKAGYRLILATNPIFPKAATMERIRWAGLSPDDFEYITTYENSCYAKPNPDYYRWLAEKSGIDCSRILMVGNDALEDLSAASCGMQVYFCRECLLHEDKADLSRIPMGTLEELAAILID